VLFTDFFELHGDRLSGDDQAVVAGLARFNGRPVAIVAQQKGRDLKERQQRNFGYATPRGYRKALRVMKLAEKVGIPVITLVDTPGADPNVFSEELGISASIAMNLREMSVLKSPIVCAVIGEGGSGGALGLAVADRIMMMEHAIYSVIAPEGCAAIMDTFGRDPGRAPEAAAALRVTSKSAFDLNLIDTVVPEPIGGAHRDFETAAASLKQALEKALAEVTVLDTRALLRERHAKFRQMGQFRVEQFHGPSGNGTPA
jgi:acetyl-CoA carboxylase carboxyl transferase subunit alpha